MEHLLDLLYEKKQKDIEKAINETRQNETGEKYLQTRKEVYLSLSPSQDVLFKHYEDAMRNFIDELGKNLYAAGAKTGMAFALSLSDTTNK